MLKGTEEDLRVVDALLAGRLKDLPSITWAVDLGGRLSRGKVTCVVTVTIWVGHQFSRKTTWTLDDLDGLGDECCRVAQEMIGKIKEIAHQSDKR